MRGHALSLNIFKSPARRSILSGATVTLTRKLQVQVGTFFYF